MTAAPGTKLPNCAVVTDLSAGTDPANLCAGGVAPAASMTLAAAGTIGPGDRVQMVFTGATNPSGPGAYTLKVSTSKDSAGSAMYRLVPGGRAISDLSVSVTPNVAGASGATYTVDFRTSASGALAAEGGTITVTAAPGTKLPNCAVVTDLSAGTDPANLCAGGVAPAASMTLTAASSIGPGDRVQMVFTGATNDAVVGPTPCECPLPPIPVVEPATTSWHRGAADKPRQSCLARRLRALGTPTQPCSAEAGP